jgi:hypothetical protein
VERPDGDHQPSPPHAASQGQLKIGTRGTPFLRAIVCHSLTFHKWELGVITEGRTQTKGRKMKTLLCGLFGLVLISSVTMLTATDTLAKNDGNGGNGNGNAYGQNGGNGNGSGGNGNGNAYGQNEGNGNGQYGQSGQYGQVGNQNGNTHAVPIPGTLLLFGAGFAGFAAWRYRHEWHSENDMPS